jgi:hypothetical protein
MGRDGSTPYPKELRDQAVRLVREWRKEHDRRDGGIREAILGASALVAACITSFRGPRRDLIAIKRASRSRPTETAPIRCSRTRLMRQIRVGVSG